MAISAAGIIFSNLNNNTLSRLTRERTVAAIPFACRYRLIDFCLSNLVNANISKIHVVANYNYRSLVEHIGSGKDWDLARRAGGVKVVSPFQTATSSSAKLFATHMEALKSMKQYIDEFKEEYVVLMDSDFVLNIDIADVIKVHEKTGANMTIVTKVVEKDYTSKNPRVFLSSVGGNVTDIAMSAVPTEDNPELAVNIYVMSTGYLRSLIDEAEAYGLNSFTEMILKKYKHSNYRTYCYDGYAASVSSFLDYYKCSIELATSEEARNSLLNKKERPIFTRVHNSAPVVYTSSAKVQNSLIADDCVIEGTVINSVISRGVHVAKGAVVKNSILFRNTSVEKNAELNCIVTDKRVTITEGVKLSGNKTMPFFVQKGRRV
ncbi:MAG: glucose-1-phosphate adenylyltransferase subunit GlgD [Ruminococcaceae bacterium]|nr:glucose-1-phosphate adenylyltransferase subunit GlgD [Oscillospiraceae bacterium]